MELDLLNLLLLLTAAWLAGTVAERLRYPSVLGELMAGILLGPPVLGLLHGTDAVYVLAELGVLVMMLYIGMEIDPRELGKASWAGLLAAVGGFVTPFVLAWLTVVWFGGTHLAGLFVGIAAGITSLATKSRILADLKILDTRVAHVLMAGALVSDTLALLAFAAIMGVVEAGSLELASVALVGGKALAFFGITMLAGYKLFPWAGRKLTEAGLTSRTFHFTLVVLLAVAFGELAELAGLHSILGAFIAGLFLQDNVLGRSLSHDLTRAVREASIGFLAPIFFVTAGFEVSFRVFVGADLGLFLAIMAVAIVGKIVGTVLFYLPTGYGWREGVTVGMGMNGRGAVEIIVAGIGLERGLISQEIFSILVFMAIFTTATVPLLLKWGTDWLRSRDELVRSEDERRGTVIVGAGPLGRLLGHLLAATRPVWLVDSNPDRCALAREEGLEAHCGNALQEQVLSDAGAARADSLVALTTNPEINALVAQLARDVFSVPEVFVVQVKQDEPERQAAMRHLQASILFGGPVAREEWEHRVALGGYVRREVEVEVAIGGEAFVERMEEKGPGMALAVLRDGEASPFHAGSRLRAGERVVVLRPRRPKRRTPASFRRAVEASPVLDLEGPLESGEFFKRAAAALAGGENEEQRVLAEALRDREAAGSTVLAPGLAVPHVRLGGGTSPALVIVRCREGIAFAGQAEPVRAAFVLAGSDADRNFHLQALAAIAQAARRSDFRERWSEARDAEALRALLLEPADESEEAEATGRA